jgi:tRNA pseudouridine55 synthase
MRRRLDGVLLLDKPAGASSNAVLQAVKRLFGAAKAGHAGTLDPLATGLLPILFGEATKFSQFALDAEKTDVARARLGETTTTGDAEGEVLERRPCHVAAGEIEPALARFRGEIDQVPPMYSALKRGGRPLYALAREGREVHRQARRVHIRELELLAFSGDALELKVVCSKGTYVRTLVEDIGRALGCGAYLGALRRVQAGPFRIDQAVTLDALQAEDGDARDRRLLPVARLLEGMPRVELDPARARCFVQGRAVVGASAPAGPCGVFSEAGELLGLGRALDGGELRPQRLVSFASG